MGLAENEVTRRGNSEKGTPVRGDDPQRGAERKGRGLEEKSRQIFVPSIACDARVSPRKIGESREKSSPAAGPVTAEKRDERRHFCRKSQRFWQRFVRVCPRDAWRSETLDAYAS